MKYDKAYFIAKFSAIPDDLWTTGSYENDSGQHCAQGHCGMPFDTEEAFALSALLKGRSVKINDGFDDHYQQPTPKARILAALNDLP